MPEQTNLTDIFHPMKAVIFITRKCNLKCDYCGVIERDTLDPELDFEGWKRVFDATKKLGVGMNVIFGGEPMFRKDIKEIVTHLNENEHPYAFITNSMFKQEKYEELNLKQLSCSVDVIEGFDTAQHSELKSQRGTKLLLDMKKKVPDLLANMGLCAKNLKKVPDIVRFFTDHGIWVIATILHDGPEDFWLFRKQLKHPDRVTEEHRDDLKRFCDTMLQLKEQNYLIHHFKPYFEHYLPKYGVELNWHCKRASHLTIDADGRLICCVDYRGERVSRYKVWDLLDPVRLKQFLIDYQHDVKGCPGCCWDHIIESEHMYSEDPNLGKKSFQHFKSYGEKRDQ